MPNKYTLNFHPKFFDDLKKLDKKEMKIVHQHVNKIKQDPKRNKRMHEINNCYRIRTGNLRIVYYLENNIICFLVVEKRKLVYGIYLKRLFHIKKELKK